MMLNNHKNALPRSKKSGISTTIFSSVSVIALSLLTGMAGAANLTVSGGVTETVTGGVFSPTGTAASQAAIFVTGAGSKIIGDGLTLTHSTDTSAQLVHGTANTIIDLKNTNISSAGTATAGDIVRLSAAGSSFTLDGGTITGAGQVLVSAVAAANVTITNATLTSAGTGVSLGGGASTYKFENTSISARTAALTISTTGSTTNLKDVQLSSTESYGLNVTGGSLTAKDFSIKGASHAINMSAGTLNLTNGTIETSSTGATYAAIYALIAGSTIRGENLTVNSTGGAMGIRAGATSDISLINSTINAYAAHAIRIQSTATTNLIFSMQGGAINATGSNNDGAIGSVAAAFGTMGSGSEVTLDGVAITTSGTQSQGIYGFGVGDATVKNGSILTTGSYANMAYMTGGASLTLDNMAMRSTHQNGGFLYMTSSLQGAGIGATQNVIVNNSRYEADAGTGIAAFSAFGGNHNVTLNDSSVDSGVGMLLRAYTGGLNGAATNAVLNLSANNTSLIGMAFIDDAANVDFTLANGSHWEITTAQNYLTSHMDNALNSRLTSLVLTDSSVTFAAPADAGDFKTLTLGNYSGQNATITLNTHLGDDTSATDRLIIDGGSATGSTMLIVRSAGGDGALTTGDGIRVVETINGATTATGSFRLGNRVASAFYDYQLFQGGNPISGNPADQNWYLRSTIIVSGPTGPGNSSSLVEVPNYRPEFAVNMAIPALASRFGLAMIGSYHDRNGESRLDSSRNGFALTSGWGRLFGETGKVRHEGKSGLERFNSFEKNGPAYDFDMAGFQAGMDLFRVEHSAGSTSNAGLYVGAGRIEGDIMGMLGGKAGTTSMDGYSVGGYWTYKGASGWYVDAVAQGTRYDQIKARSVWGELLESEGWGAAFSLETGYPINLGNNWLIEPQAQLVYQNISIDNGSDSLGKVGFGDASGLYGRVGARVSKDWALTGNRTVTTWAGANIWHSFGANAKTTFLSFDDQTAKTLKTDLGGSWTQFSIGVSGLVTKNLSVFASGDYNVSLDDGKGSSLGGRLGMKAVW